MLPGKLHAFLHSQSAAFAGIIHERKTVEIEGNEHIENRVNAFWKGKKQRDNKIARHPKQLNANDRNNSKSNTENLSVIKKRI